MATMLQHWTRRYRQLNGISIHPMLVHTSESTCTRRGQVPHLNARRNAACPPSHLRPHCIPGAIRDVITPYAAGTYNYLELLPLLNSDESLSLIEELWDTDNNDVALSVRCVTAAITAFIVTPPDSVLEKFLPPGVRFIGRETPGSDLLSRRLRMNENREDKMIALACKTLCTS
jgi:hypothetical protein